MPKNEPQKRTSSKKPTPQGAQVKKTPTKKSTTPARTRTPRKTVVPNRVKLLISILNLEDEARLNELLNEFSVSFAFSVMGRGTAQRAILSYLGIGDTHKSVMLSLIPESDEDTILNMIRDEMNIFLVGRGISFTVPLTGVTELIQNDILSASAAKSTEGRKIMKDKDRKYELIVAIVAAGYADTAMEIARSVGAAGGTILDSKSVDNSKAEQFLGISLHEESEIILILSMREASDRIMSALVDSVGLKSDARGVVFTLPVDKTVGVGRTVREEKDSESAVKPEDAAVAAATSESKKEGGT
ncbi:MAG: hypothetical protein LUD29_05680 [Clostridia bacterium]|nr:hypothetical protein [Clostridia bacterium]